MTAMPQTAMLLAAGQGTRMRPLTQTRPKPLIEVAGRTLLDRLLDVLVEAGIVRAVVNVHYLADQIEAHLAGRTDIEIVISDERAQLLETGGALVKAAPQLGDAPVLVVNTDAIWAPMDTAPLATLAQTYDPDLMDTLLLLADPLRSLGYQAPGDFFRDPQGRLTRRGAADRAPWAYAGVRITRPALYRDLPVEPFSANRVWDPMIAAGRMQGCPLDRFWLHVGDPKAHRDAEMWLRCHGA
jgi:N-acetyl-alpha-D-muramate 1-phosphate uridylyltransferase